jgi:hypothetical protein
MQLLLKEEFRHTHRMTTFPHADGKLVTYTLLMCKRFKIVTESVEEEKKKENPQKLATSFC